MVVEGYATTFNQKYLLWSEPGFEVWEQVDAKAFDETDMEDVIMQYNHEGRVFARTSNGTLELDCDDVGLKILARLSGTQLGRQVWEEIDGGYTNKMSFGFTVGEDKREETEDRDTGMVKILRTITRINKLYDVSAVALPANDATSISARSYAEGVIGEAKEEIRAREQREEQRARIMKILGGESNV
jgi:HK97 family phage prohead protease